MSVQSMLTPQGPEAERALKLFWLLLISCSAVLVTVLVVVAATLGDGKWRERLARESTVIAGGLILPVVVLTGLLAYSFLVIRANATPWGVPGVRISIVGEQGGWRVEYTDADGQRIQTANELHIPINVPVEIELKSADVIHSFWVPRLAGKLDMIPGRTTLLHLQASEPGVSRGQCAEYCGGAHALMSFYVVAMAEQSFRDWLSQQAAPAKLPASSTQRHGSELFLAAGCSGCHTIRGTQAAGVIGPDLTHVASRLSLAAATLPNNQSALARWIVDGQHVKPENRMPMFRFFTDTQLEALSAYLTSLH
jgi:cytochrome c oxidase subunit 2